MKMYILMTSVCLAADVGIGYLNGKGAAQTQVATDCADAKFAVVYDDVSQEQRHFHCLELKAHDPLEPGQPAANKGLEGTLIL